MLNSENIPIVVIEIRKVTVLIGEDGDRVIVWTYLPAAIRLIHDNENLLMSFDARMGSGVDYAKNHFGLTPEVIDMRGTAQPNVWRRSTYDAAAARAQEPQVIGVKPGDPWPEGVADVLALSCGVCGRAPHLDFTVSDACWDRVLQRGGPHAHLRLGVVCLPCFQSLALALGVDISGDIERVQWTVPGVTVEMRPTRIVRYRRLRAAEFNAAVEAGVKEPRG